MVAIGLLSVVALAPRFQEPTAAPEIQTYSEPALNLAFDYPKAWKTVKKGKDTVFITIPLPGSTNTAELEVTRTPFHSSKEIWQTIQMRINEQLKRTIQNQWEDSILSVPMLYTQVAFNQKGDDITALSGLYYTRTPLKMFVRLTAPTGEFPKAKYEFDQSMLSLRTLDKTAPEEDSEEVKLTVPAKPPTAPPRRKVITEGPKSAVKPTVSIPLTVSTKEIEVKVPEGWSGEVKYDVLELTHANLSSPLRLKFYTTLDGDPPLHVLFRLNSESLKEFTTVSKRTDTSEQPNASKCLISTIWRIGKNAEGDLMIHEMAGVQAPYYFVGQYRLTNATLLESERKLIRTLLDAIALEPKS